MARKKGARSVPAQLAIGSAADLGFLLVLTAIASALVLSGMIGRGAFRLRACAPTRWLHLQGA